MFSEIARWSARLGVPAGGDRRRRGPQFYKYLIMLSLLVGRSNQSPSVSSRIQDLNPIYLQKMTSGQTLNHIGRRIDRCEQSPARRHRRFKNSHTVT